MRKLVGFSLLGAGFLLMGYGLMGTSYDSIARNHIESQHTVEARSSAYRYHRMKYGICLITGGVIAVTGGMMLRKKGLSLDDRVSE